MRRLTILTLAVALLFSGVAKSDVFNGADFPPEKDNSHVGTNPGNTSDNIDDYDEVCPYTGSLSPDVVYLYQLLEDGAIDIDLCDSGYDTKIFIYENIVTPGAPYACNDDADCALAYRSALMGVPVAEGNRYYIVIDGYGSDMGDYTITFSVPAPP